MVALIPARAHSKRCPGKNTRLLAGHPLIAYTIAAAQASEVFSQVYVCSDDPEAWAIGLELGAKVWKRAAVPDEQPDFDWIVRFNPKEAFAILRPTSPFRTATTIVRAAQEFRETPNVHSIRAVQPVTEHPGKMWTDCAPGQPMTALWFRERTIPPPHSSPTQSLPKVWVQNSSLEMAHSWVLRDTNTISGTRIYPFFTVGDEGFAIDTEADFAEAERLASAHPELLPTVEVDA